MTQTFTCTYIKKVGTSTSAETGSPSLEPYQTHHSLSHRDGQRVTTPGESFGVILSISVYPGGCFWLYEFQYWWIFFDGLMDKDTIGYEAHWKLSWRRKITVVFFRTLKIWYTSYVVACSVYVFIVACAGETYLMLYWVLQIANCNCPSTKSLSGCKLQLCRLEKANWMILFWMFLCKSCPPAFFCLWPSIISLLQLQTLFQWLPQEILPKG